MKAYLLSLNPEASIAKQWDFGFLHDFLVDNEFDIEEVDTIPRGDVALVVIPARHHKGLEDRVNEQLDNLNRAVVFLMGDEEAEFDVSKIEIPYRHIWVQNPTPGIHDRFNKLGTGYPPHMKHHIGELPEKTTDVFFSGQLTHKRRLQAWEGMQQYEINHGDSDIHGTKGFTQGLDHQTYYDSMLRAKIAPAPSGAVIPDSFRMFEALECMCVPIADEVNPSGSIQTYWDWLFRDITPFPKIVDWRELSSKVLEELDNWPHNMHNITAWYIKYKRDFANRVLEHLDG